MNHIYHYYAFRQPGVTRTEMDGVIVLQKRITCVDDFQLVKRGVADYNDVPVEGLVLAALSYLGETSPAPSQETGTLPPYAGNVLGSPSQERFENDDGSTACEHKWVADPLRPFVRDCAYCDVARPESWPTSLNRRPEHG
jgi:hypothetical protein